MYTAAAAGLEIPTDIPPIMLQPLQTMSHTAANTTTTRGGPSAALANGGGTAGNAPEPFTEEQNKSKDFMRSFIWWWKLNYNKPVFQQPYKRVALCLNYI